MNRELKKIYTYRLNPTWKDSKYNYKYLIEDIHSNYINKMWDYLERDWNGEDITKIKGTDIESKEWKEVAHDLVFYFNLTEDFIFRYQKYLNWNCICAWQDLSENFIEYMRKKVHWCTILENQNLSEEFIRKNMRWFEHEHWYHLSLNQKIKFSEDFIRECKDFLEWSSLCDKQHFTLEFIREMKDKIYINHFNWTIKQMIDKDRCNGEFRHVKDLASEIVNSIVTLGEVL